MLDKLKSFASWLWNVIRNIWPWYKSLYQGRAWYTKTIVAFISMIVAFILYLGAVDVNLFWLFGKSPGYMSGIRDPQTSKASEIYSADGKLIGKYFNENRTPVKYEDVNPDFFKALIDTEDERFYHHYGIDPIGIFGALKDAITHHDGRGASTITQQLAKNMFRVRSQYSTGLLGKVPGLKILIVKSKEWIIATKLETVYSKKEILTMYANTVDFGNNAFGIKTAAKTYFNKSPKDLSTDECAILVGMLKATTYYNPKTNPKNSKSRRNTVLANMVHHGDLSREACDTLQQKDIVLDFKVEENYDGQAQYFREAIANNLKGWCEENGYDLYTAGLKIYTTLDSRMQKYAEDAARKQMKRVQENFDAHWSISRRSDNFMRQQPWVDENGKVISNFIQGIAERQPFYKQLLAKYPNNPDSVEYYYKKWKHPVEVFDYNKGIVTKEMTSEDSIKYMTSFMHCAMVAMEPETGAVKAWVGDIDFKTWKYDKATAMRQPGSTFKLFVYTEAMNQGLTPCDKRRDEYISMQVYDKKKHEMTTWTPSNANGSFSGDSMPLKSAFARSINSVAVRLGQEMGIKRIIETANKMGIKSPLEDEPSLALGSCDVNLLEMVNAYSVIADDGKHHDPVLVTRVVDDKGNEVYVGPEEDEQVIPYRSAFLVQQLLKSGTHDGGGTSVSLSAAEYAGNSFNDTDWGGKTGTSNNHSDAWFVGVSPHLVVGAWVGGEYRSIHFRTGALGQGSKTALPIVGYFVHSVLADSEFKKYHGKWGAPKDDISRSMYGCAGWAPPARRDTSEVSDSLIIENDEVEIDEFGNPIMKEASAEPEEATVGSESKKTPEASKQPKAAAPEKKKKKHPTEEVVSFDNI